MVIIFIMMHTFIFHLHKIIYFPWLLPLSSVWVPLDPISLDSPKRPLAYKQAFLLIAFGGIGFIPKTTIILTTYIKNYVIVVSIIVRFMVDQCPFLFETLTRVDNNNFHFQQHLKVACNFLPPPNMCMFSSLWTTHRTTNGSISRFHLLMFAPFIFSNMFFNMIFETHHVKKLSCSSFGVGAWLIV